jgi:hypothetical protein
VVRSSVARSGVNRKPAIADTAFESSMPPRVVSSLRMFAVRSSTHADEASVAGPIVLRRSGSAPRSELPTGGSSLWTELRRVFGGGNDPLLMEAKLVLLGLSMGSLDRLFSCAEGSDAQGSDTKLVASVASDASIPLRVMRWSLVGLVIA